MYEGIINNGYPTEVISGGDLVVNFIEDVPNVEIKMDGIVIDENLYTFDSKQNYLLVKPLSGTITSRFGLRNPTTETVPKYHTGIDIAANTGTIFVAAMEGKVILVSDQGDYGNHIKIQKDDVITLYAHCSKIYVTEGQEITKGQELGEVGATGNVTGSHLHFEVRRNERLVNPDDLLEF